MERFEDSPERVAAYQGWQRCARRGPDSTGGHLKELRELFTDLYQLYFQLQRESETEEIIVANGILRDVKTPGVAHPVLTHRVQLAYDAMENVISVHDTESASELYSVLFQMMDGVNLDAINRLNDDPAHKRLSSPGQDRHTGLSEGAGASALRRQYVLPRRAFQRGGAGKTACCCIWSHATSSASGWTAPPRPSRRSLRTSRRPGSCPRPSPTWSAGARLICRRTTASGPLKSSWPPWAAESVDVLLSKEANKEQLEIAHRIEQYNAVLVQGPPGTGQDPHHRQPDGSFSRPGEERPGDEPHEKGAERPEGKGRAGAAEPVRVGFGRFQSGHGALGGWHHRSDVQDHRPRDAAGDGPPCRGAQGHHRPACRCPAEDLREFEPGV